jgi:DNA-binding transcriptional MocR family regulator
MQIHLSRYGQASTRPSPVSRLLADFAHDFRDGLDINLGVGYVNEKTIPVRAMAETLQAVAGDTVKYRQAFNYGSPVGSQNLITSIRQFLTRMRIGQLDEATIKRQRLIIGACGATSILHGLAEVMAPGIVVTSDPTYYIYADVLERKGFEILAVPEDEEGPDLAVLDRKLRALGAGAERISFFYVVTVNNPSCTVLSNRRRRALYEAVAALSRRQGRLIPLFCDLAYELLLHDPKAEPFISALPYDDLGIVYEIGTLSKILAPGLRIGYLLGPDGPFMNAMVEKTSDTGFSAPLFVQEMASYLMDHRIGEQLRAVNAGYREKAVAVRDAIERNLGAHLQEYRGGSAGFYYYLTFRDIETHPASPFFQFLTRTTGDPAVDGSERNRNPRVIYIPGEYCVHRQGDLAETGKRQLRLSYGFEDVPLIVRALELMREAVEFAQKKQTLPAWRQEQRPVESETLRGVVHQNR